jgi:Zn-dependent M28 family amino/carboxypeptidase
MKILLPFLAAGLLVCSCGKRASLSVPEVSTPQADIPAFDADSAYASVARQVSFGPRVPNTPAHRACADYFAAELERYGAAVYVQEARLKAYDGTVLQARNIIGTYRPEYTRRILLCAHWDSRPFADHAVEEADRRRPIDGADDGASGCGVLLEIARQLGHRQPPVGVDIILFDAEDYGMPTFAEGRYVEDSWCLGSQFWAANPHVKDYHAEYGILLDMVGARDAVFFQELTSLYKAAPVVKKVWDTARSLGFGQYFVDVRGGAVTDDHVYVMTGRHFPCIDIIHHDPESSTGFAPHWHTPDDGLPVIDTRTLHAVGQTLLHILYSEQE